MKVSELMIGDWVKVLPISHKIEPHYDRIESIRKEYNGQIHIEGGYHGREHKGTEDWFDWSVGLNDIAPIPLTTEILKKIGFKVDCPAYPILELNDYSYIEYYPFEGRIRKVCNVIDEWDNHNAVRDITFQCHCKSVHELQHALRLCGLNEIADNLKVE